MNPFLILDPRVELGTFHLNKHNGNILIFISNVDGRFAYAYIFFKQKRRKKKKNKNIHRAITNISPETCITTP